MSWKTFIMHLCTCPYKLPCIATTLTIWECYPKQFSYDVMQQKTIAYRVSSPELSVFLSLLFPVAPACCSSRYGLALLSSFGFFVVYSLRVNLSVAMVDMLNSTHQSSANHSDSVCPAHASPARPKHNHTVSKKATAWMTKTGSAVWRMLGLGCELNLSGTMINWHNINKSSAGKDYNPWSYS